MSNEHDVSADIDLAVFVTDENEVLVRFAGFESAEDADAYAEFLSQYLSLLLFESTVMH